MRIAIIEDGTMMVALWRSFLEGSEYEATFFSSAPLEIENLRTFTPDTIICPGVPHYQTASELAYSLKSSRELRHAALILSTSLNDSEIKKSWDFEVLDNVLLKPFTRAKLLALLDQFKFKQTLAQRKNPLAVIVDDSVVARSVLEKEMKVLGFQVEMAPDAENGIELILHLLPNIALVDIEMPGKSGLELCTDLSANPKTCQLPIIVISGTVNDSALRHGFKAGAIDFLSKPVDTSVLAQTVASVMGRRVAPRRGGALVLENDAATGSIIMKLFDDLGIGAIVYYNIEEFQTHLSISIPDLISINPNFSQGAGLNLFRTIRANDQLKTVPIIAITSTEYRELMVQCLRYGSNDFLEKPFTKEEFQARIENLLRIKRLQDELVQKYKILEDLAYHDALTGLLNRRYLDEGLPYEIDRVSGIKESLGFILIDLDHFKKVNDTYGHEVGDLILRDVAALIKQNIRTIDIPCRYGGEEICVILPGCTLEQTARIAEHLRFCCDSKRFTPNQIHQTLSAGVTAFPKPSSATRLTADADIALYQAKRDGRNRIKICSSVLPI